MKHSILILISIAFFSTSYSQVKSVYGLYKLRKTSFFIEFDSLKYTNQRYVSDFKALEAAGHIDIDETDAIEVKKAYATSAELFNNILYKIKDDLLDKKVRKFITKDPDKYNEEVKIDLEKAQYFYENSYSTALSNAIGGQIGCWKCFCSSFLMWNEPKLFESFNQINKDFKRVTEAQIDRILIEGLRFKTWDEIE